jgi:hypothetical protein
MQPIIFIHNRNNDYLPISLWKVRQSNPDSEIILIGDGQNAHFSAIVKHVHKKDYSVAANAFAKKFKNFSTNPFDFELICLQRWMILEEYLKANQIENCLYIDSDVLLFDQIESDAKRFSAYGMTVAGISGHCNFISGTATLSSFCRFIENAYKDQNAIQILDDKYKIFRQTHPAGGISDMTFFTEFREANPGKVLDIAEPLDAKMFDITITYTKDTIESNGIKVLTWNQGRPYTKNLNNEVIEMRSLHFQGDSKKYMLQMANIQDFTFSCLLQTNKFIILIQKIWNKLTRK